MLNISLAREELLNSKTVSAIGTSDLYKAYRTTRPSASSSWKEAEDRILSNAGNGEHDQIRLDNNVKANLTFIEAKSFNKGEKIQGQPTAQAIFQAYVG